MTPNADSSLELHDVSLSLKGEQLFAPIELAVPPGEAATVMGPSGCGKSSLLAHICGTLAPAFTPQGAVRLAGTALDGLPPETTPCRYPVPGRPAVFPIFRSVTI